MLEERRNGRNDKSTQIKSYEYYWSGQISKNAVEVVFDNSSELPEHEHIDQQVLPVGVHKSMGQEAVVLPMLTDGVRVKHELLPHIGIAESLVRDQAGHYDEDEGDAYCH